MTTMKYLGLVESNKNDTNKVTNKNNNINNHLEKPKWFHDICDPDGFEKLSGSQIS